MVNTTDGEKELVMIDGAHDEIVVKRQPQAVAEIRRFVRLTLGRWEMDDYVPCLVASELVTNAIRYGTAVNDDVILRLARGDDGALWLEVQDAVCALPHVQDADPTSETGRGLLIVDEFTRCWGVRPLADDAGKIVFARVAP